MKTKSRLPNNIKALICCATLSLLVGCTTTDQKSDTAGHVSSRYRATDGRTIEIGPRSPSGGGWSFKEPFMELCWIADGFDFKGYDTLYIAPTQSTAKYHDDEKVLHGWTLETLPLEIAREIQVRNIFSNIVTNESEIKPGAHVLKLENTLTQYSKGGGGARYWAGAYGAGQPVIRVSGKMTDAGKSVFTFEMRRSGNTGMGRMFGGFMKDEDIQIKDIRSLSLDLADFMAAIGGKYQPLN
jgi:hypothetical protein